MPDELEERLRDHAKAFEGLLSLTPAKYYYGEDVSDQWQRKKQTPEQKRAARKAKLDPDNYKSAKDILDERQAAARKRKREDEDAKSDGGGESPEKLVERPEEPVEGLKPDVRNSKKRKIAEAGHVEPDGEKQTDNGSLEQNDEQKRRRKAEKQAAKRERKRAKAERSKEKRERQKLKKQEATTNEPKPLNANKVDEGEDNESDDNTEMVEGIDITEESPSNVQQPAEQSSASPSPVVESPILSPQLHSGTSSISSIVPPSDSATPKTSQVQPAMTSTSSNTEETSQSAKERLAARLNELRAARKADGPNGRPARNRQELLEMRRKKEEERRLQKKEQRRKAKEEEALKQQEEIARRFSPGGSGSLLASPRSPMEPGTNFSFGRVAFGDGTQANTTMSSVVQHHKPHKGPADPATALKAAQNKKSRLSGLDNARRRDIEEKDMWLNAKKRAHGERVRDDTSLLKKALKRQDATKKKSEKEWQGRLEGVAKGQEIRQRKREENLRKRKEEKGNKGGGKKNNKSKKVKRPGFEGSFKGRTGGGKKG